MPTIKVIIQLSHYFEPTSEFESLVDHVAVGLWSIEGRTNETLIKYVEEHYHGNGFMYGKEDWQFIKVVEVETSIPWTIENYDGSEYIRKIDYDVIDRAINFIKMKN